MFEASLIEILKNDTVLQGYLSTYNSEAAVFSDVAPEDAELPFCETEIIESPVDSIVSSFSVIIDYYQNAESAVNARKFCQQCIEILDRYEIDDDPRYSMIRIFFLAGSLRRIEESDPRDIHYELQFVARAGRKEFINAYSSRGD